MIYNSDIAHSKDKWLAFQQGLDVLYACVRRRDADERGFRAAIASMYERNGRWSKPIISIVVQAMALMLEPKNGAIKYFFWGTKFEEIILGLPRKDICIIGGPKQLLFCLKHRVNFLACMKFWSPLAQGLSDNEQGDTKRINRLIEEAGDQIRKKAGDEAVLVVDNDSLPTQRAMIIAGGRAGLRTVCVQHGIFQSKSPSHIMDGWFADQLLVFNEHQKAMLIAKGMNANKIEVMGFHSSSYIPRRPTAPAGHRRVCFLGQPWHRYDMARTNSYQKIVRKTAETLLRAGVSMTYKPHPWERGAEHLKAINNVVDTSLYDAIENHDVFISLTSTALIEAQAAGRVAIQLMDEAFDADDLSVHGRIISFDTNKDDDWHTNLLAALEAPGFAPAHTRSPAKRFTEAL